MATAWTLTLSGVWFRIFDLWPGMRVRPRADCGVSDGALDSYLGISRYDQASLLPIDRLRRKQQGHSGNQGIPARLRETHQ
jgi:hypothetical protein